MYQASAFRESSSGFQFRSKFIQFLNTARVIKKKFFARILFTNHSVYFLTSSLNYSKNRIK
ncbi:hypothetical protein BpHYR1_026509 [Brachionus plicatilis]|uniref:Uncharacterized protein n=1 Tax=Brachionus plicatilis TaxID=10195 RepID=A0A3M7PA05_BRAPC|nr:hypothetical protein BpHYR1_026509 [Brachionus plicatilis]